MLISVEKLVKKPAAAHLDVLAVCKPQNEEAIRLGMLLSVSHLFSLR